VSGVERNCAFLFALPLEAASRNYTRSFTSNHDLAVAQLITSLTRKIRVESLKLAT